jgi:hypothetical protein
MFGLNPPGLELGNSGNIEHELEMRFGAKKLGHVTTVFTAVIYSS